MRGKRKKGQMRDYCVPAKTKEDLLTVWLPQGCMAMELMTILYAVKTKFPQVLKTIKLRLCLYQHSYNN